MRNKFWKLFALIAFVALFVLATWFMYTRYTLKSPYYGPKPAAEHPN